MTAFQIGGIAVCGVMALFSLRRLAVVSGRRVTNAMWTALWACATAAFVHPDGTTVIARSLGIDRGADMVLYSAVLAAAVGFWVLSMRLRVQARQITLLTRELALRDARAPVVASSETGSEEPGR